ncbi:MAG: corrinoid protein [bacterium]
MELKEIVESLIKGNANKVKELVNQALEEQKPIKEILNQGLLEGMNIIGGRFKRNEVFIPEVLIAARAMHAGMDILEPFLSKAGIKALAKIAIGTVKGDLHNIGKNLVVMMWKGAGFEVIDLGIDVATEKFIEVVKKENVSLIGMSALLTTTMTVMKQTIDKFKEEGLRDKVKIMIGGAPISQNYADEIEADGYAPDAASAVDKVKELLKLN